MNFSIRLSLLLIMLYCALTDVAAQKPLETTREQYISQYAPIAMKQQKEYGIPASIKIAQGLYESRHGNSNLAKRSNNHFGIKCKKDWIGDTVKHDDDEIQECFRSYSSIEDSYRDHSEFLKKNKRYQPLFELNVKDYKGWAKGLKECGYATAPHYATGLIKLIEDYELYLLDDGEYPSYLAGITPIVRPEVEITQEYFAEHPLDIDNMNVAVYSIEGRNIYLSKATKCIISKEGDSFKNLSKLLGISEKRLKRYNKKNITNGNINIGSFVYIEKPKA